MTYTELIESGVHLADQTAAVLDYMVAHGGFITSMEAISALRCTRLSARIWDLRHAGFNITGVIKTKKNEDGKTVRWGEYKLHMEAIAL